jgi:hypothetical protein
VLEETDRAGTTVLDLVRRGRPQEPWRIYPGAMGIFDRRTRCQFYFHAHGDRRDEAGHFHTVRFFPDHTVHLVAISMTEDGRPRALFTVNAWATGERPEPSDAVKRYAREFRVGETRGPRALVRFVNLVFQAFLPEIERLQDEKDAVLAEYRRLEPGQNPYLDRRLEVLSRIAIDVGVRQEY